jgi:hypothetical protein
VAARPATSTTNPKEPSVAKDNADARHDKNVRRVARSMFGTSKDVTSTRKSYPDAERKSVKRDVK